MINYKRVSLFKKIGFQLKLNRGILKYHLHMASMNAIRHYPELRGCYQRKQEEGKGKMTVLNAVRNKLLRRIVAVVKRGTP